MNADRFPYFHPGQAQVINGRIQRPHLDGYDTSTLFKELIDRCRFCEQSFEHVNDAILSCTLELIDEEINRRHLS